ncbi:MULTISPECIES: hypothetical protein [Halomonadaceae]|uniref:Uncharacterized protein n=1 Tax=Vreelandella titanicae TaxID=664683 RepID=A0AAP9NL10_9GAMM|nr:MULTISPECIES: hypothetical protein [Halomonas]QKS23873.1 hypothetical protein FX987_01640 [Halomonas titanicae]CDG54884.1 hypothetical protein HALA3H3_820026 [Halomonas sp. A3H3]SDJ40488.1 hypothetical protein SAMN04487867_1412 [Halomonas titanicae]
MPGAQKKSPEGDQVEHASSLCLLLPAGSNVDEEGKEARWLIAPLYSLILCHIYCDLRATFLNIIKNQIFNKKSLD